AKVARLGAFNALSQTLLALTAPGVPDVYQGNETWDFSLVDPDNRHPVDFETRARRLCELDEQPPSPSRAAALLDSLEDGRVKLYVTRHALAARRAHSKLFAAGAYLPLRAGGARRRHVCAFARVLER